MPCHFTEWITFCLLVFVLKTEFVMNLNREKIKENWPEISRRLKAKYRDLEDRDLTFKEDWDAELLNRIEAKVGKSKDELIKEINEIIS
jgi:hypothetical protein